jgi:hypothetical protein
MTTEPSIGTLAAEVRPGDADEVCDIESPPWQGEPWPLAPDAPVGQSFRARRDGLCAVEFLLAVNDGDGGEVSCHWREDGPDGRPLASDRRPMSALASGRYARFALPPVAASAGRRYYVWLDATAPGVAVYTAGDARLGDGTAYRGHAPADGCLAFRIFAIGADARLADRRQIEALLAAQAELTHDLLAARQALRRLTDERAAVEARLRAALARLTPTAPKGGPRA